MPERLQATILIKSTLCFSLPVFQQYTEILAYRFLMIPLLCVK